MRAVSNSLTRCPDGIVDLPERPLFSYRKAITVGQTPICVYGIVIVVA